MSLLKRRPRISVRAPAALLPGETFDVEIKLTADREVPIEFVSAKLLWIETIVRAGQQPWYSTTAEVGRARLLGATTLPRGNTVVPATFRLASTASPSYRGRNIVSQYHLDVHASVPWWPDRRMTFAILVAPAPPGDVSPRPVRYSTAPEGPRAGEPYLEASLAADVVEAGGTLSGAFAIGNADLHRFNDVDLALVALERARIADQTIREEVQRFRLPDPPPAPDGGEQSTFSLRVPERLNPTTTTERWALNWFVEIEARRGWGRNLITRLPVTIVSSRRISDALASGAIAAGGRVSPPVVGSDRMRAIWSAVGTPLGLSLSGNDELRGSRGDAEVTIRRERRGREGIFIVGEARFPPLHLGLEIRARRALPDLLLPGFRIGAPDWAERHHVTGRDEGQVRILLDGRVLDALRALGTVHVDDATAVVERRDAGLSSERLAAFATHLLELCDGIAAARRVLPPPAAMVLCRPAWEALADRLGTELEPARMAVDGRLGGARAVVRTEWSPGGQPRQTVAALYPDAPLRSDQATVLTASAAEALTASLAAAQPGILPSPLPEAVLRWPMSARALLGELLRRAHLVDLGPDGLVAHLVAPLLDPMPAMEALEAFARLRSVLYSSEAGPYR